MRVQVFDDWFSVGHLLLGFLALITPLIFIIYLLYELVEFMFKHPKEKISCFIGDILEFFCGLGFGYLIIRMVV
ncbi:MAG: hypothetical protein B6U77_00755 [Candidatus Hecatellales archaeon ex4484_218]|nr:MAG: hypothetical protein B6U77_00755 [Candidatus Hecatellales archaeon ex4484_218]